MGFLDFVYPQLGSKDYDAVACTDGWIRSGIMESSQLTQQINPEDPPSIGVSFLRLD